MEKGEQGLPNGKPWQLDSPLHWLCKAQTCCSRGLYSSFDREKPPYKKLPFLADFIKNWAPFIKNSILTIFTDPKAKIEYVLYSHISLYKKLNFWK